MVKTWCIPVLKVKQRGLAMCSPRKVYAQVKLLLAQQKVGAEGEVATVCVRTGLRQDRVVLATGGSTFVRTDMCPRSGRIMPQVKLLPMQEREGLRCDRSHTREVCVRHCATGQGGSMVICGATQGCMDDRVGHVHAAQHFDLACMTVVLGGIHDMVSRLS